MLRPLGSRMGAPPRRIHPPTHGGKGIHQIGIKTGVYLGADTTVRGNFDEIWNLPFEFGAVPDVYVNKPGFMPGFNTGVLFDEGIQGYDGVEIGDNKVQVEGRGTVLLEPLFRS